LTGIQRFSRINESGADLATFYFSVDVNIIQEIEKLLQPVLEKNGVELVDIQHQREHTGWVIRVLLDKPGGISLKDCETLSEVIGETIDGQEFIHHPYALEVSSPGIDRPLKKEEDFVRYAGERVRISLYAPKEGQKNFKGNIVSAHAGRVVLDDVTGKRVTLDISAIAKAKLDPDIKIR